MQLFYCPEIKGNHLLDEQESFHAVKVLRLKKGDMIRITDGKGSFFEAEILLPHSKKCEVRILSENKNKEKDYYIHIAIAPTKSNERNEWFLEKSIEIGVDEISFIQCAHSERKGVNAERLNKVAVAAMKQSLHSILPKINPLITFSALLSEPGIEERFIAHLEETERKTLVKAANPGRKYLIAVGPEGDFTKTEIDAALQKGFQPVSLGNSRLRTETAGIAACFMLNMINSKDG